MVTLTEPEGPEGATAVILVGETTIKELAATPAKLTDVTLIKLVPVMVTVVPAVADVGVKDVIVGGGIYVKPVFEPWPVAVTTLTLPDAPLPTVALIEVFDKTVKAVAGTPPKLTAKVPEKLSPVMLTTFPVAAAVGVNEETITGG